jgi:hypothetical protein
VREKMAKIRVLDWGYTVRLEKETQRNGSYTLETMYLTEREARSLRNKLSEALEQREQERGE